MRAVRPLLVLCVFALLVAGCGDGGGSDGSLGSKDIAVVGSIHINRDRFDSLIEQAKRSFKQQGRPFPEAGSREYATLKYQAVNVLVSAAEREIRAKQMGIVITDEQVDKRLEEIKKQYFQGSDKKYEERLKDQGLSDEQVRADLKSQLINDAVFKSVTTGLTVKDDEIHSYYLGHLATYKSPESREVRHILIALNSKGVGVSEGSGTSGSNAQVDFAKSKPLADKVYAELKAGGNFTALAKKYSQDPGSKDTGGKLTVARGQTVPEFDATAFKLKTGELSKPVKTQYGYHLIEALGKIKPPSTTPEKQVRDSIREQLLQTKKNEAVSKWAKETEKKLAGKVRYAAGFKPPASTTPSQ